MWTWSGWSRHRKKATAEAVASDFTLLLASSNAGKQRELQSAFFDLPVDVVLPVDVGLVLEVTEDGNTYEENARKKAVAYWSALSSASGEMRRIDAVLADDSGIEVDALDGGPGLYSARYAGVVGAGADAANIEKMLTALSALDTSGTASTRAALFRCILLYWDGATEHVAEGVWPGAIAETARGAGGFGYDPIFQLPDGRTAAELPADEKRITCHRGRAAAALREWLAPRINAPKAANEGP